MAVMMTRIITHTVTINDSVRTVVMIMKIMKYFKDWQYKESDGEQDTNSNLNLLTGSTTPPSVPVP